MDSGTVKDPHGVRITPPTINFSDTEAGEQYRISISVKNVSKTSKAIRFYGPVGKQYQLKCKNKENPVAPGLEVQAHVEFDSKDNKETKDRLVVTVDGEVIEIPLRSTPAQADLSLDDLVDFGSVVASSKVISKDISVINKGSDAGLFKIKYDGRKPISIFPSSGTVPAKSSQEIKIEYVTSDIGQFEEDAIVTLDGKGISVLKIKGDVVERVIQVLDYDTKTQLQCVDFGNTYYGTDQTQTTMLYNNGPEVVHFVAIFDQDAVGQEEATEEIYPSTVDMSNVTTQGATNALTSLIAVIPNQGTLAPYEQIPIFFRFSPRWNPTKTGYKCSTRVAPKKDYALFVKIQLVGSSTGFLGSGSTTEMGNAGGIAAEVALTGTALPVLLDVQPQKKFDFEDCPVGEHVDALCSLVNESVLPVSFEMRKLAHFSANPPKGKIGPAQSKQIIFSFFPNQVGTFKPLQLIDVIGMVADNENPFIYHFETIHTASLQFRGTSVPITRIRQPKFNPGITPKVVGEVGQFVSTTFSHGDKITLPAAMLNSNTRRLHQHKNSGDEPEQVLIAFPNDRTASIRPSERNKVYKTVFTKIERHNYVDPDYTYTDEEMIIIKAHREYYKTFLRDCRENRVNKQKSNDFDQANNITDIGIKFAQGLTPNKITLEEMMPDPSSYKVPIQPNQNWRILSSKELAAAEMNSTSKPVCDGLNAIPTTDQEKVECKKYLSPQQLHQVIVGPPSIDFGNVCARSTSIKDLDIVNNLNQHIHIVVDIDCRELRQSSPLSQVVPPNSKAKVPLIFESNNKGIFQRSVNYKINGFYQHHVTVLAKVVPVALEMNTSELVLKAEQNFPAEAGFRGVVTLINKLNYPAEFTWKPILGDKGTAFSIRPATGVVDAFQDLDCEVVFHPSYLAPEDGDFELKVHSGDSLRLKCQAKFGSPTCQFISKRIVFGQVPLHLTTVRTAMIHNSSTSHAYFQVTDPNPFEGLIITPMHGVVPIGGNAEVKVHLTPHAVMKFDTKIEVAIRGWKKLELRVGGTVEPPRVDIDLSTFNLGGVFVGSSSVTKFKVKNMTTTMSRVDFDLCRYSDFSLRFPGAQSPEDYTFQLMNPGMYSITLDGGQLVHAELVFTPTEVAAYDFVMPVLINQTGAPTPTPTPVPPTPTPSNKNTIQHIINPKPIHVSIATPRRRVVATALRQPLQMSHYYLEFSLPSGYYEKAVASGLGQSKGTLLVNNSDKQIKWSLDVEQAGESFEDGTFKFLHSSGMPYIHHGGGQIEGHLDPGQTQSVGVMFCPKKPGKYTATVPVVIDDMFETPYNSLELVGEVKMPKIWFDPHSIVLVPVPLSTEVSADLKIYASDYEAETNLDIELPEVECEDGSKMSPVSVTFLEDCVIKPCAGEEEGDQVDPHVICCKVSFSSDSPVSFNQELVFIDQLGQSWTIPVTATADNCVLTNFPFLAQHRLDYQIVCEQGTTLRGRTTESREKLMATGEAVFIPCATPSAVSRPSTSATSSQFEVTTSSYEDSSQSLSDTNGTFSARDGAQNKIPVDSQQSNKDRGDIQSRSLGSALFPDEDTEEGIFHTEVLLALQRWFSAQGWPGGHYPISVPQSLRTGLSKLNSNTNSKSSLETANLQKEIKTVYDMVGHLAGKPLPGVPLNSPLPADPTERVKQIHWQHSTLLTFIRHQGGCIVSVKAEYLMQMTDYKHWNRIQKDTEAQRSGKKYVPDVKTEEEEARDDELYEAISKKAWTDVLLQLLKTLVLSRITPRQLKKLQSPDKHLKMPSINVDPLCSNIYSVSERVILAWLNHHYEHYRHRIWQNSSKGSVPPSRWVVNFDFDLLDGLVLGAVVGAYVPFLVKTHLQDMYTNPSTAEQCLHNALKLVNALHSICLDYDIQAIDVTDPNPISLLLFCIHLYQKLQQYLPKNSIEFVGSLHECVQRQVLLTNPSARPLIYECILAGRDGRDFSIPSGNEVTVNPKGQLNLNIEYRSRFLRPAEGMLILVGKRQGGSVGSTLVFNLNTRINNITPKYTLKCSSPCYEHQRILLTVTNPFKEEAEFRIVLVEDKGNKLNGIESRMPTRPTKTKLKKVRSRTNHGQRRADSPPSEEDEEPPMTVISKLEKSNDYAVMNAFYTSQESIQLDSDGISTIEVYFLPFHIGKRQCSLIFINEQVGEFLYSVEATAVSPLPLGLPSQVSKYTTRVTSAAAASHGRGQFGGDDNVIYWKCEANETLKETLKIPIVNVAQQKALALAAQQQMSAEEFDRRVTTGTLNTTNVMADVMKTLTGASPARQPEFGGSRTFTVELDSEYYSAPNTLTISDNQAGQEKSAVTSKTNKKAEEGVVDLPITFKSKGPGHYPCQITLTSQDDIRVYRLECTVNPEGSSAVLEFETPVHQSVTQDIPLINQTNHDWPLVATIDGQGFYGPPLFLAKAYQTNHYPLMFRPKSEANVQGQLTLRNTEDGTEHVFEIFGVSKPPLALDHIKMRGRVKEISTIEVEIPNVTNARLTYQVESDIPFITGAPDVTVLPGKTVVYKLFANPTQRGIYKGAVAFVASKNGFRDVDSDGDDVPGEDGSDEYQGYTIWYSVDINVEAAAAERMLTLACTCQTKAILEVGVNNPTQHRITLDVLIDGEGLSGLNKMTLQAREKGTYDLTFFPAIVGRSKGSLTFYNEAVGEFWYDLELIAETPQPIHLNHMQCELGRWTEQNIVINNPTSETLELIPTVSNTNNFILERDNEKPITLKAYSQIQIPLHFMPSMLGKGDHEAKIMFHCEQVGELVYFASGTGLLPKPQPPVSVYTAAGSNTTLIIPFKNPLDHAIAVNVELMDKDQQMEKVYMSRSAMGESPFCLLLKHYKGIRVGPKSTLDIPISFAPEDMRMYEALCVVKVSKEGGYSWVHDSEKHSRNDIQTIKWHYPIHGIPEAHPVIDNQPAIIECQARSRVEERLEITLSGVAPNANGPQKPMLARAVTPKDEPPRLPEGLSIGEANPITEEFTYELLYNSEKTQATLERAVAINLIRQYRHKVTGLVSLVFNIIYAPYTSMSHDVQLMVRGVTGGVWKFPIRFTATEPTPDDTIKIEAVGLGMNSSVGFRLTSQSIHPVSYNGYFAAGSDEEFTVSPQSGELLPAGTQGTMIRIGFTPYQYGKIYQAKLIIQTDQIQWAYNVRGVLPDYNAPRGTSSRPMAGPHPDPRKRSEKKNYIRENLKLACTGISSPLKGSKVIEKS